MSTIKILEPPTTPSTLHQTIAEINRTESLSLKVPPIKLLEPPTTPSTMKQTLAKINRTKSHLPLKFEDEKKNNLPDSNNNLPAEYLIRFQEAYGLALEVIPAFLDNFKNIYKNTLEILEINPTADSDEPDPKFIKEFKIDPLFVTSIILKLSINEISRFDDVFLEMKAEISKIKQTINVGTVDCGGYWNNYYGMLYDGISLLEGGWSRTNEILFKIPHHRQKLIFYTAFQKLKKSNHKVYYTTTLEKLKEYDLMLFIKEELRDYFGCENTSSLQGGVNKIQLKKTLAQ